MQTILNTSDNPAHDSLVEKKSEFIGDAAHVDTLDEALAFVTSIREQHPKARHVAYAAVCGGADGRLSERMSDDGEPSGTAGKPILDVLKQSGTTDCVIAVTRYFGGILLGSGGLVRAYSSAASLAMKAAQVARIMTARRYRVHLEYPQLSIPAAAQPTGWAAGRRIVCGERRADGCGARRPLRTIRVAGRRSVQRCGISGTNRHGQHSGSSGMTKLNTMTDENPINETQQSGDSAASQGGDANGAAFEPLTASYERLRHSTDSAELSEFARRPLPDRSDQAAFSRATALLEAVAGNKHTPVEDRVFLASTMPFPNVLVKLSVDPEPSVRVAVAANEDDKNWLVGRLTKDPIPEVRDAALRNKRTSWKMRLEGAQDPAADSETLDYLGLLGTELEEGAPAVLSSMVRRAVALNPNTSADMMAKLAEDPSVEVRHAVESRR